MPDVFWNMSAVFEVKKIKWASKEIVAGDVIRIIFIYICNLDKCFYIDMRYLHGHVYVRFAISKNLTYIKLEVFKKMLVFTDFTNLLILNLLPGQNFTFTTLTDMYLY